MKPGGYTVKRIIEKYVLGRWWNTADPKAVRDPLGSSWVLACSYLENIRVLHWQSKRHLCCEASQVWEVDWVEGALLFKYSWKADQITWLKGTAPIVLNHHLQKQATIRFRCDLKHSEARRDPACSVQKHEARIPDRVSMSWYLTSRRTLTSCSTSMLYLGRYLTILAFLTKSSRRLKMLGRIMNSSKMWKDCLRDTSRAMREERHFRRNYWSLWWKCTRISHAMEW